MDCGGGSAWLGEDLDDVKPEVVHREVLPAGDGVEARIAQLVDGVKAGRFTPTT